MSISSSRRTAWHGRSIVVLALALALMPGAALAAHASQPLRILTVSNRADLISGGQALVEVAVPAGVRASQILVTLDGRDVSSAFATRPDGRLEGLVTGLAVGKNVLVAREPDGSGARLIITNHPIGGPVFSGPQYEPWPCEPGALDAQCDKSTSYSYEYMSSSPNGGFKPYDPSHPPSDVATTTTQTGKTVPFIVRVEAGYEDRDQYQIAVLFNPQQSWSALSPQPTWNGKAVVKQGQGCGNHHGVAGPGGVDNLDAIPNVMDSEELGLGFAVMAPALDNSSHNCNVALQSESVMMLKQHLIDSYGQLRFTIAQGCSGGSLSQLQDENAYPGLYQGLLPGCTFPDAWSSAMDAVDCPLMESYYENPTRWGTGVVWTENEVMAAEGKVSPSICLAWKEVYPFYDSIEPGRASAIDTKFGELDLQDCGLSDAQLWSPSNLNGVRCTLQDGAVNIFGRRSQDGYAQRPISNVGIEYGLRALEAGTISPAQFVDLNQKVGSWDINMNWQPTRMAADRGAVDAAYRSGAVNETNNLADVAIIDQAAGNTDIHEEYRAFAISARMDQAYGNHDNHVIWYGIQSTFPDPLLRMDEWLTAVEKDYSTLPLATKIAKDRPADAHDICNIAGQDNLGNQSVCQEVAGFGTGTRGAAGSPITTDNIDCQLKPLQRSDYYPIQFTDAEWAQLKQIFPTGVCDWSKRGIGQRPNIPWQTYTEGPGGRPLGPPPESTAFGPPRHHRVRRRTKRHRRH